MLTPLFGKKGRYPSCPGLSHQSASFLWRVTATPNPVGPGKYDMFREIAPFNVRTGPPIDHLSGTPGMGQYEAKPLDESQCDYTSVFNSRTKRSLYGTGRRIGIRKSSIGHQHLHRSLARITSLSRIGRRLGSSGNRTLRGTLRTRW